jgi:hypothetical protein
VRDATTVPQTTTPTAYAPALVRRAGLHADGTRLALHDGRVVHLPVLPDPDGPVRVRAALRRVASVELFVDEPACVAFVRGLGHRNRCRLQVSVGTALALALDGVPATVTVVSDPTGAVA